MTALKYLDYPPVWLAAAMALAWFMAEVWAPLGSLLLWPGRVLIAVGIALAVWAVVEILRARTTPIPGGAPSALVTSGPYAFSRNPIYLADLLILAGWCLAIGTVAGLVLLIPLHYVLTRRFILPEEAMLGQHFPEARNAYYARVRRWI